MSSSLASVVALSYGLAGVLHLLFALRVGAAYARGPRRLALLWAVGGTAVWGLATASQALWEMPPLVTAAALAEVAAFGGWFLFLTLLTTPAQDGPGGATGRKGWTVAVAAAIVLWGLVAQVLVVSGVKLLGDPGRLAAFDILAAAVLGLVLIEQVFRNVAEESRWSVTPLCVGLAAAFAFDVYVFAEALLFNRLDPDVWAVRGFVRSLALPFVIISLGRTKGGTAKLVLSRQMMFRSTTLAIAGVYLLFMAGAGYYVRYFGGQWGRALQAAFLFAGVLLLVLLLLSGSIRAKLRVTVSKHFFRYRYDYREEWLRFTQSLSADEASAQMGQQVIKGLADLVESPGGILWLRDAGGAGFDPAARWNARGPDDHVDAAGEFVTFLQSRGWVINLEEFRYAPDRYGGLQLPAWLSSIEGAWLIVPLTLGAKLSGFVVLLTSRTPLEVNWEVNDLLKTAGRQAASFLGHAQATEALLEARKFDAFNRMSAFVVHDLKNIVAQLSLMVRNAERHRDNPEFQQDMLMTVEHSVERMKQLMLQLRVGTTPLDAVHRVDLADVATRVQRAKATAEPCPELHIEERLLTPGHDDRVERVIGHLVQNAIDATPGTGRVWIKIARADNQALVEVGDTGHGMTADFIRERLFKPFQTTKPTGMGIGAYESHQYVQELGGRVLVESAPDKGTIVRLLLPLFKGGDAGQTPVETQRDAA